MNQSRLEESSLVSLEELQDNKLGFTSNQNWDPTEYSGRFLSFSLEEVSTPRKMKAFQKETLSPYKTQEIS